jgi:glycyl-tRNA synthetase beta chain
MARGELVLEVRAEEIPARMLEPAVRQLGTRVFEELVARGLTPKEVETGFTPRRLVLMLRGLPDKEQDREEQLVGPPARVAWSEDGEPTKALLGFARRCGLAPEQMERITTDKGEYAAATQTREGQPTSAVLAELLPRVLGEISWAKQMRWGHGEGPWVRPVHGLLALFSGEPVPFELFGVASGAETVGHPVLSPEPFSVEGIGGYLKKLAARGVEVRPERRRKTLAETLAARAEELGGTLVADDELLTKLAAICEIPGVMAGTFDEVFLELPREVLITSLRDHQSAFTVEGPDGALLPAFLTVMDRSDDPEGRVRSGNEWVVEARLADARFFYQEDSKTRLAERARGLAQLTFHERLGSYADKAERIAALAELLAKELGWTQEIPAALEAASLLKADLTTQMVAELTSLQGVMGGLYARREGYPEEVWQALYDQYLPASLDDPVPRGRVGAVTALADRLDTLVGIFGLGLIPTGSRDPFGLRRAAQGVVRIALEGELELDLDLVAAKAARLYGERLSRSGEEILDDLRPFFYDRIRHLLGHAGYAYDEIEAALAVGATPLPDLAARVEALHRVRQQESFLSVVLAAKRIVNIVKDAPEHTLKPEVLVEPAAKDLHAAHQRLKTEIEEATAERDYERALTKIGELAQVLDRFFVEVLVMDENERLRNNRIALLQAIYRVISRVARLTEVVVDKTEHRAKFGE